MTLQPFLAEIGFTVSQEIKYFVHLRLMKGTFPLDDLHKGSDAGKTIFI